MAENTNHKMSPSKNVLAERPVLRPQQHSIPPSPSMEQSVAIRTNEIPLHAGRTSPKRLLPSGQKWGSSVKNTFAPTSPSPRVPGQKTAASSPTRPAMKIKIPPQPSEGTISELKINVHDIPADWDTGKVYNLLKGYGRITRIEVVERRGHEHPRAWVTFSPRPQTTDWIRSVIVIGNHRVGFSESLHKDSHRHKSPKHPYREFAEEIKVPCSELKFGVMESRKHMLVLRSINSVPFAPMEFKLDLRRKGLEIDFAIARIGLTTPTVPSHLRQFKMQLSITEIESIVQMQHNSSERLAWVISLGYPPVLLRKAESIEKTHEKGSSLWNEWQAWNRQTEIAADPATSKNATIQLQRPTSCIDIGRWRSYLLIFDEATAKSPAFKELHEALSDHGVQITKNRDITFGSNKNKILWDWLDNSSALLKNTDNSSMLELHQLAEETIRLPFELRYQLEVCVSLGILHECNITKEFLERLAGMNQQRALRLLEKVADEKERFYKPDDIFKTLMHQTFIRQKQMPSYCATVRAAIVTPTTIYFMSSVLEISNRVIRKFQHYEDRFLRVKFTDEKYKGKVQSRSDETMNEVYTRIKRTMKNGIRVGDRHYEFLAFGNSQFREHGAWFFAPTSDLTAAQIRERLGDFSDIRIVAKYCSRVGQCFSTTRATTWSIDETKIPDIERGGFCFTDGVGKISQFLAQMIAQELGYRSSISECPTAFQFRREGCKGILVVDPSLTKQTVQIRPSQEKFSGISHRGLEIVRVAQFSTAYLNIQLILVLSALGVEDGVFVRKMRSALRDLEDAMTDETKALELLLKNIDCNHMTIQLASMVMDGFMETNDPFTISCLRLWRSWTVKYLKEKARISVEKGAFVLGCVDETATLKGHFNHSANHSEDNRDVSTLPEIFLQIDATREGKWQVIEGICLLARNPSLHPGDVRVVHAVNVPALHHIRNCVVFPQTGDRDIPNMCSGGDLDGDDYLVVWDPELLPSEWNHPPMDYTGPRAVVSEGNVTVDDMTSFFVQYMKNDNLARIAVAHRYWADRLDDGVKDATCIKLAELHSMAVDYMKTGCPAKMPKSLNVKEWPHWAEAKKPQKKIYHSKKVIGQLYDEVKGVDFVPAWNLPFDRRVLDAYPVDLQLLAGAHEIKQQYDTAMRRIMAKYSVENEFEIWTSFVRKHSDELNDYKIAETVGEASSALKDTFREQCYEQAGTTHQERDWSKLGPFVAAMYTITANEVTAAMSERNKTQLKDGKWVFVKEPTFENMPLMSFPWLFAAELGRIANKSDPCRKDLPHGYVVPRSSTQNKILGHLLDGADLIPELQEVEFPRNAIEALANSERRDTSLSLPAREEASTETKSKEPEDSAKNSMPPSVQNIVPILEMLPSVIGEASAKHIMRSSNQDVAPALDTIPGGIENSGVEPLHPYLQVAREVGHVSHGNSGSAEVSEDEEEEIEVVAIQSKPSALVAFAKSFGF